MAALWWTVLACPFAKTPQNRCFSPTADWKVFFCTVWGKLFLAGGSYIFISFVRLINATASSLGYLKYLEERKRFMHIFAAELDLVELLLDFWVKIPSWYKSVKFHWFILDDQLCGGSGLPQLNLSLTEPELLCTEHMTVAAVFLCRERGINFCYLLSLCSYKERQVCVCVHLYTHRHAWMFIHTDTHTQRTVLENPLPLSPIIITELIHPRLWLIWNLTEDLDHSVQIRFSVPKNLKPNRPKPCQAWRYLRTMQLQAEII